MEQSIMDLLHSSGVSSTFYLQTHYSHNQDCFLLVSMATDIYNTFFLLFPIWFHVEQAEAIKLVWVAVVGDSLNLMLLLLGERPYWWVQETGFYGNSSQPIIEQFPITCETGPGSPSGHAMGESGNCKFSLTCIHCMASVSQSNNMGVSFLQVCVSLWMLFWCVQVSVCLSRVFVAAHFPHEVIIGVIIGILVAESLSWTRQIFNAYLCSFFLTSLLLLSLALLMYVCLWLVGVSLLWSVEKAQRWCRRAEWVSMDTSPLASLFRNSGTLLGLGLGLHSPLHAHSNIILVSRRGEDAIYRFICLSATLMLLQFLDSAFQLPAHSGALFYLLSFCKSATVPLATVAIVPCCVTAVLGYKGEKLL
uniref:Glucose-6-phosphatase catalytic subunit 1 n=1 Tax=Monopterus albus TaxID=43700 RepID=A0A3Q3JND4_MONAL